jgi:hypothetical protein
MGRSLVASSACDILDLGLAEDVVAPALAEKPGRIQIDAAAKEGCESPGA